MRNALGDRDATILSEAANRAYYRALAKGTARMSTVERIASELGVEARRLVA